MKKLVLGALLAAVASSTGCIISDSTEAVVTARWSFTHYEDNTARSCPIGFDTTTIISQPWDPISNRLIGSPVEDLFDCVDGRGTTAPIDGIFLVWVQVENDAGTSVYAKSKSIYVDTADGDVGLDFPIYDDAGYFFLTWDLEDAVTRAPMTCEQAGLVGGDTGVETTATIVGTTFAESDVFDCDHYFGTTAPLLADTYVVSVSAVVDGLSVGTAPALNGKLITAPSGLTDLGHVIIPID
jgi:hypothetical protein